MEYRITRFVTHHLPSLTVLLDRSFGISSSEKFAGVHWKLLHRFHKDNTVTFIALDEDENVVSHYSNLPVRISYLDKLYKSMICVDMATDEKHRGKKLISQLAAKVYDEVVRKKYDFTIGFSNDDGIKVDRHASNYGYHIVGRFVRYFKVVLRHKTTEYKLVETESFDPELHFGADTHFLRVYKNYHYLTWRYIHKPDSDFNIYQIVRNDLVVGFVVLRFLGRRCYVYDLLINSLEKEPLIEVCKSVENKALDKGFRLVIYHVLDNRYWRGLFGKFRYLKKATHNVNYFLTVKIHNPWLSKKFVTDPDNWLLMNGDIL